MSLSRISATFMLAISAFSSGFAGDAFAQSAPLKIEITEGVIEPLPLAAPGFIAETAESAQVAEALSAVVVADLVGTQLFREIPREAHISDVTNIDSPPQYIDWKAINAEILIIGSVLLDEDDSLEVKFRLFDIRAERSLGDGVRFKAGSGIWRRIAHKVADAVYSRVTGETGFFDTRVAFISESGPKDGRTKRLAIMDYDGANLRYLTRGDEIVISPRFSPDDSQLIFTSYESGSPRVLLMNIETGEIRPLVDLRADEMTFAPRFSPDGRKVIFSLTRNGNTDIYETDLDTRSTRRLTESAAIDTAPSYSEDGDWIAFESDRNGTQQLYIKNLSGGEARRISRGEGRYGTPVWSPRGDYVAFTNQRRGRFHIGVMRLDGSEERLLSSSFLDEGPTWSPNGRVLMFFRETPGEQGGPELYSVDLTGRNLRKVNIPILASDTPGNRFASDPAWGPLRN